VPGFAPKLGFTILRKLNALDRSLK